MTEEIQISNAECQVRQHGSFWASLPRHSCAIWISSFVLLLTCLAPLVANSQTRSNKAGLVVGAFEPNVPLVFLDAKQQIVSDPKVPCTLKIIYPKDSESTNTSSLPGVVRIHGATSQAYPKKSFGVTLEAPWPVAGMRPSAHWVLNAAYVDRSLMRHKL